VTGQHIDHCGASALEATKAGKTPCAKTWYEHAQTQAAGIPLNIAITKPKARSKKNFLVNSYKLPNKEGTCHHA
jgi:hypothetical protein